MSWWFPHCEILKSKVRYSREVASFVQVNRVKNAVAHSNCSFQTSEKYHKMS